MNIPCCLLSGRPFENAGHKILVLKYKNMEMGIRINNNICNAFLTSNQPHLEIYAAVKRCMMNSDITILLVHEGIDTTTSCNDIAKVFALWGFQNAHEIKNLILSSKDFSFGIKGPFKVVFTPSGLTKCLSKNQIEKLLSENIDCILFVSLPSGLRIKLDRGTRPEQWNRLFEEMPFIIEIKGKEVETKASTIIKALEFYLKNIDGNRKIIIKTKTGHTILYSTAGKFVEFASYIVAES